MNGGIVKPGGDPLQALIDVLRIEAFVKLLVHDVGNIMEVLVNAG